jgi:carboxypeptidase PM20D1
VKKVILALVLLLATLTCIVLGRTAFFPSRQLEVAPFDGVNINHTAAIARLAESLRFKTVSSENPDEFESGEFLRFHDFLKSEYPLVHAHLAREVVAGYSLLYTWEGTDRSLRPILLMGHIDVVPAEPEEWIHPPFQGLISGGYIWGRGALDNKFLVLGIMEAAEKLLAEGFQPERTVYLAFGHDEEIGGEAGAAQIAALLHARGVELEYLLDEGAYIVREMVPGVPGSVALIGIAQKGYFTLELTVKTEGGHGAVPPRNTAVGILSTAVHRLEDNPFPPQMEGATRAMFEYLASEMPFIYRMAVANLWLFRPVLFRFMADAPESDAMIRTSQAVTVFQGGERENVLPTEAKAFVNIRTLPGDSATEAIERIRRVVADPRVNISIAGKIYEPTAFSNVDSASFALLNRTIREVFPEVAVAPFLVLGRADAIHYAHLSNSVYLFSPAMIGPEDHSGVHGPNERISVESYQKAIQFYYRLIRQSTTG